MHKLIHILVGRISHKTVFFVTWLWHLYAFCCRFGYACMLFILSLGNVFYAWHGTNRIFICIQRHVKFLKKKKVTTRTMTTFSEQGTRTAHARRKTESGNTSFLLTSLVKWSAKLIGTLCSARIIINVSANVIPWPVFECDSTQKKALVPKHLRAEMIWWRNVPLPHLFPFVYVFESTLIIVP